MLTSLSVRNQVYTTLHRPKNVEKTLSRRKSEAEIGSFGLSGRAQNHTVALGLKTASVGTQTEMTEEWCDMMRRAESAWQSCLSTHQKLKFEELRTQHMLEIEELLREIKVEKSYRDEQSRKVFEQWHQNIALQCVL